MCLSVFPHPRDSADVNTQLFISAWRASGEHHAACKGWGSNGSKGRPAIISWGEYLLFKKRIIIIIIIIEKKRKRGAYFSSFKSMKTKHAAERHISTMAVELSSECSET